MRLGRPAFEVAATAVLALAVVFAVDVGIFRSAAYRAILAPDSTAGSFEREFGTIDRRATDPAHDVLVLGDSRILAAFSPAIANAHGHGLRFLSAGIVGTDPRCWYYFLRDVDPRARRFADIVIPLDDYNDDDGSLGADDAADHASDINYLVYRLREADAVDFAWSFDFLPTKRFALETGIFHAFALRRDLYALLADPSGRMRAVAEDRVAPHRTDDDYPGRSGSLNGLHIDAGGNVADIDAVPELERAPLLEHLMHHSQYSAAYAAYRGRWLGGIAARYRGSPTRIVFVRIPAAPLVPRRAAPEPHAVAYELARSGAVTLVPAGLFNGLEQPKFFNDHDHVNDPARRIFSATLAERIAQL